MSVDLEEVHVKEVYDAIADHFSNTRYKAWPVVDLFVQGLPSSSVGLDVGSGNGKNMLIRSDLFTLGFDLSWELLRICVKRSLEAIYGNMVTLPFRDDTFDFCMSIAAIHHLASPYRRRQALLEMLRVTKAGGLILLFAWALEQPKDSSLYRHPLECVDGNEQDVLVPWVNKADGQVHRRYYHLFRKGELEALADGSPAHVVESGYDRDNWYVIFRKI